MRLSPWTESTQGTAVHLLTSCSCTTVDTHEELFFLHVSVQQPWQRTTHSGKAPRGSQPCRSLPNPKWLKPSLAALPLQALRGCLLLHFAAADLEDARGAAEGARKVYEELVAGLVARPEAAPEGQAAAVAGDPAPKVLGSW